MFVISQVQILTVGKRNCIFFSIATDKKHHFLVYKHLLMVDYAKKPSKPLTIQHQFRAAQQF